MYFTKIRLNGLSSVDLPKVDASPSDLYILKGADGLGPPEVDVSISQTLNAGGHYQGRRPQSRELVFLVGLNPDYSSGMTAADLRTTMYGMLTPGSSDSVLVEVMDTNGTIVQTTAYVSKLEIVPFTKDPAIQITMPCLQQYLQAPSLLYVVPETYATPSINNVGTAPAGFHMEVIFTSDMSSWTLTHSSGRKMTFTYGFLSGDKLIIDTRPGSRGIWVLRNSITTNIIYSLSADSTWHMFHGGTNNFTVSSASFTWGDVYYLPQYWGI